ncbi:MAG: YbaN family protein [Aquificaceae bacterium]|nr:YbaN family protein [Aquificaceae bacterium]MCS7195984.1 YbaN family protein [Aquificaceae bacterium]MCX7989542.1 YbaN family protein [Aquificaceae bacterium]MDW8032667.1 DUF454 family protein [Aquificaceae bacterium]MDW8295144.1 DUF454 family protein [Aquificaceae bacterium]
MKKSLYRFSGFSFFALGTIGIFLPVLPTVPLYLLSVLLLTHSSKRDVVRLKRLPILGKRVYPYIKKSVKYLRLWSTRRRSFSIS